MRELREIFGPGSSPRCRDPQWTSASSWRARRPTRFGWRKPLGSGPRDRVDSSHLFPPCRSRDLDYYGQTGRFLSAYPLGNAASVSLYDIDFHSSAGVGFAWGGGLEGSCEAPPSKTMPQGSHAPSSETQRKRGERVAFSNNMSGGIARISDSHPA